MQYSLNALNAYKSTLKTRRQDNIVTGRNVAELQLAQLPGVSIASACDILDKFKATTFAEFVRTMDSMSDNSARRRALQEVKLIGKKKAEKIIDILFNSNVCSSEEVTPAPVIQM